MTAPVVVLNPPPLGNNDDGTPRMPVYANHVEFYREYLSLAFARDTEAMKSSWCAQWRAHPEAEAGVDALWRAWEVCQLDYGTGLAGWLANLAYPIMERLLDGEGTFKGCTRDKHEPLGDPLPDES